MNLIPLSLVCSDSQLAICEGRTLIVLIKTSFIGSPRKAPGDPLSYSVISTTVRTTAQT